MVVPGWSRAVSSSVYPPSPVELHFTAFWPTPRLSVMTVTCSATMNEA